MKINQNEYYQKSVVWFLVIMFWILTYLFNISAN